MKTAGARLPEIGLLLAGSLCLLPFLMPHHELPVKTFHAEWLAAVLGISAALAALIGRSAPLVSWPVPARWLVAFALFLALLAAFGGPAYLQLPLLAALYVLWAALMLWLGAQLTSAFGTERVATVLAAFLLAGALLTALIGVIQFHGRPKFLENFVFEFYGNRAYGNIAQANLYANYLAVGESALLYLWLRARVPTAYALPALMLLVLGSALAGSRSTLLYALWFAVLGSLPKGGGADSRRLKLAVYSLAGVTLVANVAIPWLNNLFHVGPLSHGALDRALVSSDETAEPRPLAWLLALRLFAGAPVAGVGIGEFAGAAFDLGLDPVLVQRAELWTSPHNLPLHLLAETGIVGAVLALGSVTAWGWQVARRFRTEGQLAVWWIVAAVGVEMIHSLIEFPLWYMPYLGVTALLMGVGAAPGTRFSEMSRASRTAATAACAALAVASIVMLGNYLKLHAAYVTGTTVTLTRAADAQRDAATMRELTHGLMAPVAELWIVLGAPLDRDNLAVKVAMSGRVARFWPIYSVLARHAVFLAFEGETRKAQDLLASSLRTFPHRRDSIVAILQLAQAADPGAIEPLLRAAASAPDKVSN
ncbi:MAG TPA: Wzy polymerase domain-containing protein [Burkholderiales bacterium]|nr:Wzy polymerase domain-containing protein [Burkholderiales bacterium]